MRTLEECEEMDAWLRPVLECVRVLTSASPELIVAEVTRNSKGLMDILERCEQGLALHQELNTQVMELWRAQPA